MTNTQRIKGKRIEAIVRPRGTERERLLTMIATLPWSAKKAQWPEGSSEWAVLGWDGGREYGIEVIVIDHLTEDVAKLIAAARGDSRIDGR